MVTIAPTVIPTTITPGITKALGSLVPNACLQFVPVRPMPGASRNKCVFNVREAVDRFGGQLVFGWAVALWPKVLLDCIGHAVLRTPDGLLCVTPPQYEEERLLFAEDPSLSFDFDDPQARMPHKFIPLSKDPWVIKLINIEEELLKLQIQLPRMSGPVEVAGRLGWEIQQLQHQRIEAVRRVVLRTRELNDPCVCQSGRKFRKCCRPAMFAAGPY